jgi:acetyl-CoA acetyltransferase family protein
MEPRKAVIVKAARTPIGKQGGILSDKSTIDLGVLVADEVLRRADMKTTGVDEAVYGNCGQEVPNVARAIALKLQGGGQERHALPGITLQRNCGSGHEAIMYAARAINAGERDVMIAGGTESMSRYTTAFADSAKLRNRIEGKGKSLLAYKRSVRLGDIKDLGDDLELVNFLWVGLSDPISGMTMPHTAEKLARTYNVPRELMDEFSMESHRRAARAWKQGQYNPEVVPVDGVPYDECVKDNPDPKKYKEQLRIKGAPGTGLETDLITAYNACPINDGAAAALMMSEERARFFGLPVMGYVAAYASEACDPSMMGIGPSYAIRKLLKSYERTTGKTLTLDEIGQVEINEAFAAVVLANAKELGLPLDKVNPRGGAIAMGHPVGATGVRNTATLLYSMIDNGHEYGIVSACVGGGQGVAILLHRPTGTDLYTATDAQRDTHPSLKSG